MSYHMGTVGPILQWYLYYQNQMTFRVMWQGRNFLLHIGIISAD